MFSKLSSWMGEIRLGSLALSRDGVRCDPFPRDLLLAPLFLFGLFGSSSPSVAEGDNGTELVSSK